MKHFSPLQGQYGFDILKECILKNDVSLIEFIELGWDIDYVSNGYNLLYFACYLNLENHVEILVKHMKQIDHPDAFPAVCSLCILGNPYIAKKILYIDKKTAKPTKMEIKDIYANIVIRLSRP